MHYPRCTFVLFRLWPRPFRHIDVRQVLQKFPHLRVQSRQISLDRLPDNLQIDLEVTVRNSIAHLIGERQGQFAVLHRERAGEAGFPGTNRDGHQKSALATRRWRHGDGDPRNLISIADLLPQHGMSISDHAAPPLLCRSDHAG